MWCGDWSGLVMVESGDVLDGAGSFQQDGDIIIGTGPTRSWGEHEDRDTSLCQLGWAIPGWIRPCCCCSVCSVEEIDLFANSSSAASSWSLKGGRDWPCCRCWCPWCWWTCAAAPLCSPHSPTHRQLRVAWPSYPWERIAREMRDLDDQQLTFLS